MDDEAQEGPQALANTVMASARGAFAERWCKHYHLNVIQTFSIEKYTLHGANALALFWASRMQFLFDMWDDHRQWDFDFKPSDLAAEAALDGVMAALQEFPAEHAVWVRLQAMTDRQPRR